MIVLLTGKPGAGKTTVLEEFLKLDHQRHFWILSKELRDENGTRIGFEALTSDGIQKVFAHKKIIQSEQLIGDYRVDRNVIDTIFTSGISQQLEHPGTMFVLDEIGRMQMLSPHFVSAIDRLFESSHSVLATIRFGDVWTKRYTNAKNVIVFEVSENNRQDLPEILKNIFEDIESMNTITDSQKELVMQLARQYARDNQMISIKKLFKNAIPYIKENRVQKIDVKRWRVDGDHGAHEITYEKNRNRHICDCPFFLGQGDFAENSGECSHIQAVKMSVV